MGGLLEVLHGKGGLFFLDEPPDLGVEVVHIGLDLKGAIGRSLLFFGPLGSHWGRPDQGTGLPSHPLQAKTEVDEDLGGDAFPFAQETQ